MTRLYRSISFILLSCLVTAQIHRTSHHNKYKESERETHSNNYYCDGNDEVCSHIFGYSREVWIFSILSAFLVGLSGVLPIFIISIDSNVILSDGTPSSFLKLLLGFSVGGLLSDVFLHLLPEAYSHCKLHNSYDVMSVGIYVLLGLMFCLFIEKLAYNSAESSSVNGWLNLMANFMDNFTHGLAVAGSYTISINGGIMTTIVILLHEIPHEIGDFAILIRSGFSRWDAGKAQLLTGLGGMCGASFGLMCQSVESAGNQTSMILPFISGCFINIALVTIVPDLLQESNPKESFKQIFSIITGVTVMWCLAI